MKIDCKFPWRTQPLSQIITDTVSGVSLGDNDFADNGFPVAHKGDVRTNGILDLSPRNSRYVTGKSFELNKRAQVTNEYLVVSLRDLVPAAPQLGLINKLPEDQSCVLLAQGTYGFKVDPKQLDMTFLSQLSSADFFRSTMKKNAVGSTQKHLRSTEFFELEVPVPPIDEQEKIAKILSTWDEAIEKLEKWLFSAQSKFKIMNLKLTNGLDAEEKTLGEIIEKIVGGGTPSRSNVTFWTDKDDGIPWMTVKDLKSLVVDQTEEKITSEGLKNSSANLIKAGTVIVATRMAVGKTVYSTRDVAINQDLKALVSKKDLVTDKFLFYSMLANSSLLESKGTGSTVKGIVLSDLSSLKIKVPLQHKQEQIVLLLDAFLAEINSNRKKLNLLKIQKQGLMQQLLTGKKRVKV